MGTSLRPRANALRCSAFRVQLLEFLTGLSIMLVFIIIVLFSGEMLLYVLCFQ